MDWNINQHKIASDLCRTAREEYRKYCFRTQAATYTDSAFADFETAIEFGATQPNRSGWPGGHSPGPDRSDLCTV